MIKWPGTGGIQGEFSGQVAKGIHQVYDHTISCDGWSHLCTKEIFHCETNRSSAVIKWVEGLNFATHQAKAGLVPDEHFMKISVAQQVTDWKPI
jgi:hypothetical protein